MTKDDKAYHSRRERDHRALAQTAVTGEAKQAHLTLAEGYAARLGRSEQP